MQFIASPAVNRMYSVLPLLGISLLGALLVLAMACFSLSREDESVRTPSGTFPRPPSMHQTPTISLRVSRTGAIALGGEEITDGALPAAWQRERTALRLLGSEPSAATVVVRADRDVATVKVQRLIEMAQRAGFTQCVLRPAEPPAVELH
jgi:biopolymer transport protein ExbD